jgi:hypothetical protein
LALAAVEALEVVAELAIVAAEDGVPVVPPDDCVAVVAEVAVEAAVVAVEDVAADVDVLLLPPQAASSVEIVPPAIARPPTAPARLRKRRRDNPVSRNVVVALSRSCCSLIDLSPPLERVIVSSRMDVLVE